MYLHITCWLHNPIRKRCVTKKVCDIRSQVAGYPFFICGRGKYHFNDAIFCLSNKCQVCRKTVRRWPSAAHHGKCVQWSWLQHIKRSCKSVTKQVALHSWTSYKNKLLCRTQNFWVNLHYVVFFSFSMFGDREIVCWNLGVAFCISCILVSVFWIGIFLLLDILCFFHRGKVMNSVMNIEWECLVVGWLLVIKAYNTWWSQKWWRVC